MTVMSFPSDPLVGNTVFLPLGLIEKPVRFHHSISDLTASIYTSHAHGKPDFFVFRHICHCDLYPDIFQLCLLYTSIMLVRIRFSSLICNFHGHRYPAGDLSSNLLVQKQVQHSLRSFFRYTFSFIDPGKKLCAVFYGSGCLLYTSVCN